jgi:hypothetical protein
MTASLIIIIPMNTPHRQLALPKMPNPRLEHGGDLDRGKRKQARPYSSRRPMHLVWRSSRARGAWSLRRKRNEAAAIDFIEQAAIRYRVKIYKFAVTGTHIHALARAHCRKDLQHFLRFVAGRIAQHVTGARRGQPCDGGFWDEVVYSCVLTWGRQYRNVYSYIDMNLCETMGLVPFRPRGASAKRAC